MMHRTVSVAINVSNGSCATDLLRNAKKELTPAEIEDARWRLSGQTHRRLCAIDPATFCRIYRILDLNFWIEKDLPDDIVVLEASWNQPTPS